MWRVVLIGLMLLSGVLTMPAVAQEPEALPVDLAAMPVPPDQLPAEGYQFARGAYLTRADVRYLIEQRYALEGDAIDTVLQSGSWRQGYTGTYVLLADRAYRLSDPMERVTTTIFELDSDDAAETMLALLSGSPPEDAEDQDPSVDGATTWRVVTSQEDTLVSVVQSGRYLVEVVSADSRLRPDPVTHAGVLSATLERVQGVARDGGPGISQQLVLVDDDRLIPAAVATESPLVHTWYRVLDGQVIPAAGELVPPDAPMVPIDAVVARQTAELSSQNWLTVGLVVARFDSSGEATAFGISGELPDPLDEFATSEERVSVDPRVEEAHIEAISGETRVGGRYSGYRVTIVEGDTVARLTIRAMGSILLSQDAVEGWAARQRACLAGGDCDPVVLESLLRTPDPGTPIAGETEPGRYASPVAPWSVSWDTETWQDQDRFAQGGYDYLYLRSERMDATFETIVDHRGDPEQCVLDELARLREDEDRAAITVGSDNEDEPPGGMTEGHAWVIYTIEPLAEARAAEEYTLRIDCYTVVDGEASLVVQVRAPRAAWADLASQADALRSQIEIAGVPVSAGTGDALAVAPDTRSVVMINRRTWTGIAA